MEGGALGLCKRNEDALIGSSSSYRLVIVYSLGLRVLLLRSVVRVDSDGPGGLVGSNGSIPNSQFHVRWIDR